MGLLHELFDWTEPVALIVVWTWFVRYASTRPATPVGINLLGTKASLGGILVFMCLSNLFHWGNNLFIGWCEYVFFVAFTLWMIHRIWAFEMVNRTGTDPEVKAGLRPAGRHRARGALLWTSA